MADQRGIVLREILASARREFERTLKLYLAWLLTRVSRRARAVEKQQCWLLGGMSGRAYTDNSAALHHHLVQNHPDLQVYWVIDRDSPDVDRVKQIGPVLYRDALETYVVGLQARVHVISHGLADVPTCASRLSRAAFKVRLGHGLTALKRTKGSLMRSVQAKNRVFDLVPVSSEFERKHKLSWGIDPRALVVTGLPRFDELVRKSRQHAAQAAEDERPARILYMPTWREWLPPGEAAFRQTAFYAHLRAFLLHPGLDALLAQHHAVLDIHLHAIIRRHAPTLARDVVSLSNVRLIPPGTDLQDALARSRLLITDYSSIAWDFLYIDRPVLFYQFDMDAFNRHHGAYVDLDDLFGPIARDADAALACLRELLARDLDPSPYRARMEAWQQKAFRYRDTRNCERVVQAITGQLDSRGTART